MTSFVDFWTKGNFHGINTPAANCAFEYVKDFTTQEKTRLPLQCTATGADKVIMEWLVSCRLLHDPVHP